MAKRTFKDNLKGRRQSANIEDRRPAQRAAKAKANKAMKDLYMPHNKIIKSKDLKRVKADDTTKLINTISNEDPSRATRLKNYKSDTKPQKLTKPKTKKK